MPQAVKAHHLCFCEDYKRGVLEILLNSKEALIMLSTVSPMLHVELHTCSKRFDGEDTNYILHSVCTESAENQACL